MVDKLRGTFFCETDGAADFCNKGLSATFSNTELCVANHSTNDPL